MVFEAATIVLFVSDCVPVVVTVDPFVNAIALHTPADSLAIISVFPAAVVMFEPNRINEAELVSVSAPENLSRTTRPFQESLIPDIVVVPVTAK